jgi:hypothetical protein
MQGAKISEFISEVKQNGLSRTNRFAVSFGMPQVLEGGVNPFQGVHQARLAMLLCENIQIPGVNFNTIQNRTFGEFRETPYEKMYDPITATFYVDREMKVKKLFDKWQQGIQNPDTREFNFYKNYTTNMQIYVNDTLNQTYYGAVMYEVYPKSVSAITLDHNSKEIMKLSVTFQYKYWIPISVSNRMEPVPFDASRNAQVLPTYPQPEAVVQRGAWGQVQSAWDDVQNWLGNPTIPDFNVNGDDVATLRSMLPF